MALSMNKREAAWEWADTTWHPHCPDKDELLMNVRNSLRRLQSMPLPVAAILEIETLMKAHAEYILFSEE